MALRASEGGDSRHIEGYALVFGVRSEDLGGFTETIDSKALEGVLERSDIMALLNHDISRGVLARFRDGGGSLKLEVDSKGLKYSFDAPNTALGDEVLEGVKRGDISGSSFAFTVLNDKWTREENGDYLRTILGFDQLFDVSPVYNPAYLSTSVEVDSRGLDALKEKRAEEEEKEEEEDEQKDKEPEQDSCDSDDPKEADSVEDKDENSDERKEDPGTDEEEKESGEGDSEVKEEDKRTKNVNNHRSMKKEKFSLLKAVRAAVEGKPFDDTASYVFERGREAANAAGIDFRGNILLPLEIEKEHRYEDNPTGIIASQEPAEKVAGKGGEVVPTELFDILGPLYDRMIITKMGARTLSLKGNAEIPLYSGVEAEWASEIEESQKKAGTFKTIKMSPKRIAVSLPISKQFLIQTSPSVEALLRSDVVQCIANKLQATILGAEKGTNTKPAGMLFGVTAETDAFTFEKAVAWEEQLEEAKITGEKKYALSPRAKAIMRTTKIDAGSGLMVMQNNEVLGIPALSSGAMKAKGVILGDWSQLFIASFGAVDIVVDPYTRADRAQILLHVNAWFDYAEIRPEAFVKKILK